MAVADHFETVQKIYIAFYQRPADPAGLRYWAERVEVAGGDTGAVINAFATSEEATALYGDITEENIGEAVTAIYQALFGRAPDAAGLAYYEEAFANGELTAGTIALSILDGAQGEDTIAINNKLTVANEFTEQVAGQELTDANFGQGGNFAVTYDAEDVEAARDILAGVTAAPGSVLGANAVREALQQQIANEGDAIQNPGAGNTFTLTDAVGEVVTGTAGNDTFSGVLGETLNVGDQVNGLGGTDTLNLYGGATSETLPTGASINSVEIVNLIGGEDATGSVAALTAVNASRFQGVQQLWQVNAASDVSAIGAGVTVGFRDVVQTGSANVDLTFTGATANIALDDDGNAQFNIIGTALRTVNISGSADELLEIGSIASKVQTINLALDSDSAISVQEAATLENIVTIDASKSTGDLEVGLSQVESLDLETLNLGSGADQVAISLASFEADEVAINLGAGNDSIQISLDGVAGDETVVSITGGAGSDTFVIGGADNALINSEDEELNNVVTINDFGNGADVLALVGFEGFTAQNLVDNALSSLEDDATLYDAVVALADVIGSSGTNITNAAKFEFDGNTYVYQGINETNQVLIELTGSVDLNNDNVVGFDV